MDSYLLEESQALELATVVEIEPRWMEFLHGHQRMRGLVIVAGEVLHLPWMQAPEEPWLSLSFLRGVPRISDDGLDLRIEIECEGEPARLMAVAALDNQMPDSGYSTWECALPVSPGQRFRLVFRCGAGPLGQPEGDWLGLTLVAIGECASAPRRRARANARWRMANEIAHFDSTYRGDFYGHRQVDRRASDAGTIRRLPDAVANADEPAASVMARLEAIAPNPGENAYLYADRLLWEALPIRPPEFATRLRDLHARQPDRRVRMLSLCAGEAGVEGTLLAEAGVPVDLCLLDINAGLLDRAAMKMPDGVQVDRVLGDANQLAGQLGRFDVINITSGLHHLVELEAVLAGIATSLERGGEFWLIGEQVGRNGNRLWPEARTAADRVFSGWPATRRRNAGTGQVDERMPDIDCSSASFEGIRSQEILPLLQRYFLPVDVYLRNCFLWRLFNAAYAENFDLEDADDLARVRQAVEAELSHWACGGVGTELFGVYHGKQAQLLDAGA